MTVSGFQALFVSFGRCPYFFLNAIAWATVVGFTAVINTLSEVVLGLWQMGQLAEMTALFKNASPLTGKLSSLDEAMAIAAKAAPDMEPSIITYPGTMFTSKHHYAIFVKGKTPLTKRIIKPALIDEKTGKLTDIRAMPWFVNALFISEPLHFGDYGGLPLKIIWALFDIATIIVLGSGLYLWFARNKATKVHLGMDQNQKEIFTLITQDGKI